MSILVYVMLVLDAVLQCVLCHSLQCVTLALCAVCEKWVAVDLSTNKLAISVVFLIITSIHLLFNCHCPESCCPVALLYAILWHLPFSTPVKCVVLTLCLGLFNVSLTHPSLPTKLFLLLTSSYNKNECSVHILAFHQTNSYSLKQWAADSSQRSPIMVAPQKCIESSFRLTCQGISPLEASVPPTILLGLESPGRPPHSEKKPKHDLWVLWAEDEWEEASALSNQ